MTKFTDESNRLITNITESIASFKQRFDTLARGAQITKNNLSLTKDDLINIQAKFDHLILLQNTYINLNKTAEEQQTTEAKGINTAESCFLTAWYNQPENQVCFKNSGGFAALEGQHFSLHQALEDAAKLYSQNWQEDSAIKQQIVAQMANAEKYNRAINKQLDACLQEKHSALN